MVAIKSILLHPLSPSIDDLIIVLAEKMHHHQGVRIAVRYIFIWPSLYMVKYHAFWLWWHNHNCRDVDGERKFLKTFQ